MKLLIFVYSFIVNDNKKNTVRKLFLSQQFKEETKNWTQINILICAAGEEPFYSEMNIKKKNCKKYL